MAQHSDPYELFTPVMMEVLRRRFAGMARPAGPPPSTYGEEFEEPSFSEESQLFSEGGPRLPSQFRPDATPQRPPPVGSTAYWAMYPPPKYDPSLYEAPQRTAEGGYELKRKPRPRPVIQTLKELRQVANELRGVPPEIAKDIMLQLMGRAGIDPEAARNAAIAQILLQHELGEPGRAEARATAKERTAETKAKNRADLELREQQLELRQREADDRLFKMLDTLSRISVTATGPRKIAIDELMDQIIGRMSGRTVGGAAGRVKVMSPKGQVGTISRQSLKEALAAGYKLVEQ